MFCFIILQFSITAQAIPGVPKIKDGYNPAAWMLEVTSPLMENRLGIDFADYYRKSKLFQYVLVKEAIASFNLILLVKILLVVNPLFIIFFFCALILDTMRNW